MIGSYGSADLSGRERWVKAGRGWTDRDVDMWLLLLGMCMLVQAL